MLGIGRCDPPGTANSTTTLVRGTFRACVGARRRLRRGSDAELDQGRSVVGGLTPRVEPTSRHGHVRRHVAKNREGRDRRERLRFDRERSIRVRGTVAGRRGRHSGAVCMAGSSGRGTQSRLTTQAGGREGRDEREPDEEPPTASHHGRHQPHATTKPLDLAIERLLQARRPASAQSSIRNRLKSPA